MNPRGAKKAKEVNGDLQREMDHFIQIEPTLVKKGLAGYFVVIHERKVLAKGKTLEDAIKNVRIRFCPPPEPFLVRQVLGERRKPVQVRSPKRSAAEA